MVSLRCPVTLTASDDDDKGGSGVAMTEYSFDKVSWATYSAPFTISTEATSILYFRSIDKAGNTESAKKKTIKIDKTPPIVTATLTTPPNADGWNKTDVKVSFSAVDSLSGIRSVSRLATLKSEGAGQSITGTAMDKAGNAASATITGINIDKTPPTIIGTRTPSPNANGWNKSDVTVSYTAADSLSGVDRSVSSLASDRISTEGAGQTTSGTAVDKAGNSSSATVTGINIDKTPPSLDVMVTPDSLWPPDHKLAIIEALVISADNLSNVQVILKSIVSSEPDNGLGDGDTADDIQGASPGIDDHQFQVRAERSGNVNVRVYTVTYTATDGAGNSTTATTTVTVR